MATLTLSEVSKTFHLRPVLRDISFTLGARERLFLLGRNGCGKTTLLKILAGVMSPQGGSAELDGQPLFSIDGAWRQSIAYMGHHPNLYPSFTPRDNMKLALQLRNQTWDEQSFIEAMERFGLAGRERDIIGTFSEGMLRRLGLVRLSLSEWEIALLDEPSSGLDLDGAELLSETINGWHAMGRSVLFTSHDIRWGTALADRSILLTRGSIAEDTANPTADQLTNQLSAVR